MKEEEKEEDITLLNVEEMAQKIKSTAGTVYAWVSMHKIPANCVVKLGGKLLFDLNAVNQWLVSCKQKTTPLVFGI